jgi:hypothetical protein
VIRDSQSVFVVCSVKSCGSSVSKLITKIRSATVILTIFSLKCHSQPIYLLSMYLEMFFLGVICSQKTEIVWNITPCLFYGLIFWQKSNFKSPFSGGQLLYIVWVLKNKVCLYYRKYIYNEIFSHMKVNSVHSSEMLVNFYWTTWHHIPDDGTVLCCHCCQNFKCNNTGYFFKTAKGEVCFLYDSFILKITETRVAAAGKIIFSNL